MRLRLASVTAQLLSLSSITYAAFYRGSQAGMGLGPTRPSVSRVAELNSTNGWGTFEQLLNHSNPDLGTFSQRYWYSTRYWGGPGSPIILVNLGQSSAEGFNETYLDDQMLPGLFAQTVNGAVVIMEHRYWGESSPFDNLTTENLQYLTLRNSLMDNIYFAKQWEAPFDGSGNSTPDRAPWIYTGCSYSGALAGWLATLESGTFWAYQASSAVVQVVGDFWEYFRPVIEATPQNCSTDLTGSIAHMDEILLSGDEVAIRDLKDRFALGDLEDVDFASALQYGPWSWEASQFHSEKTRGHNIYYRFCDYVENVWPGSNNTVPGPEGVGIEKAIEGYSKWFKEVILPNLCESSGYADWQGETNTGCLANSNASSIAYKDWSPDNWVNRQWSWMSCNEPLEWWQVSAPDDHPTIVSRLVNRAYFEASCRFHFPEGGYGLEKNRTADDVNAWTGGWTVTNTSRLMHANGQYDTWRDATVSSVSRPGGPLESTSELPVMVIPGGMHCSDVYSESWEVSPETKKIAYDQAEELKRWVNEFYEEKGYAR